jgi:tripartite-type tricarboxylate transporter receptor subunit TctC
MMNSRKCASFLLAASGLLAAASACAQSYPTQRIRAVVGYGAGGGADTMIRAIVPELSEALGQGVALTAHRSLAVIEP